MKRIRQRPFLASVGVKLGIGLVLLLILMASVAWYSSYRGRAELTEGVGVASEAIAESLSASIDRLIQDRGHDFKVVLPGYGALDAARQSNEVFDTMEDPESYIDQVDEEWISASADEVPDSMREVMENNLSLILLDDLVGHYLEHHGTPVFGDTIITNAYGAVIASTHRPIDFRQDDEVWWQSAVNTTIYFTEVLAGENSEIYGVWACVPMVDDDGSLLGVARTTVNVLSIMNAVGLTDLGYETSEMRVTTADGRLIYSTRAYVVFQDVSSSAFFLSATEEKGHFAEEEAGTVRLFSYVRSVGYMDYVGNHWVTFLSHSEAEVLGPASEFERQILLWAAFAILTAVAISFFLSRSLTKPIAVLTTAAKDMAGGMLDRRVEIARKDELGALAESFNEMAEELQGMYAGLDSLVKERTKELESANKKLSVLGSITRHDALNHLTLQRGWIDMAMGRTDDQVVKDYLRKVGVATDDLVAFLEFTSDYERVGVAEPHWLKVEDALESAKVGLDLSGVKVNSSLGALEVFADPMFPKVLHNLMGNSLKHGGGVSVLALSAIEGPEGLTVVYEDDGMGVPEDRKERLFERQNQKGERSHGMFLSAEILEMTGMSIREVGVPGKGARFEISVPRGGYRASG